MIFAFVEDGTIEIFENEMLACEDFESVDVESGVVTFFDENGNFLEPVFTRPNRYGKILWLISWCESGTYHLLRNPGAEEEPLWMHLLKARRVGFNKFFRSLSEVTKHLLSKGVDVDGTQKTLKN